MVVLHGLQLQRELPRRCSPALALALVLAPAASAPVSLQVALTRCSPPPQDPSGASALAGDGGVDSAATLTAWMVAVRAACNEGTFSQFDTSTSMCQTCPTGKVDSDFDPVTPCETCPPGKNSNDNLIECLLCPAGRVGMSDIPGCMDCQAGKYSTTYDATAGGGSVTVTACANCAVGTYSPVRSDTCIDCAALGKEDEDSNPVTPCKEGFRYYYQPQWTETGQCWPSCETMGGIQSVPWGALQRSACCDSSCGECNNRWEGAYSCYTNPGGISKCCPLYGDDDAGQGILQSGVSCLIDPTPPCYMEDYGRAWTQETGWVNPIYLPEGAGRAVLAIGASDATQATCMPITGATMPGGYGFFNLSQRQVHKQSAVMYRSFLTGCLCLQSGLRWRLDGARRELREMGFDVRVMQRWRR